ncbi:MAG: helix-turn-helix transcriptional regulator [Candidatus Pristimantibacillus sp.]
MPIQIYILSKLMDGNNYPYKLSKELSEPIPFDSIINLTESKLYYHFDSLLNQGLIESVEVIKEAHRPDKQVFTITDKGREQLPLKIYQVFEKAPALANTLVGLINIRFVEREKVAAIFEKRVEKAILMSTHIKDIYGKLDIVDSKRELTDSFDGYFTDKMDNEIHWTKQIIQKLKNHEI